MRDLGLIENPEPAQNLVTQGMVLGHDGTAMSKSKGNVIDPEEMVGKYGADTCRLFVLFAAPPEKDMPWIEASVGGQRRFLERVWRFVSRNISKTAVVDSVAAGSAATENTSDKRALRKLHQTIRKVTEDFNNRWHFNTSIAALMELINTLYEEEASLSRAALDQILPDLTLLLAPFAPFIAEELWEQLGRTGPAFRQPWPQWSEELAKEDLLEIPVQVNGKLRAKIAVPIGTSQAELEKLAQSDAKVQAFLDGKTIAKVIVVADKLVNIVVR
jgi:leucyl-tRNA synthetase